MTEKLQPRKGKKKIISIEEMQKHIRNYKPKETVKPEKLNEIVDSSSKIYKKNDVYVIKDITLYGLEGKPTKKYNEVELDDSAPRYADNKPLNVTQDEWIAYYYTNTNKRLLSLPLLYSIMETVYDNLKESDAQELSKSLEEDFRQRWLVTSTRLKYLQNEIWHDFENSEQIEIIQHFHGIENNIEDLVKKPEWEKPLRAIFMAKDIKKIPKVLGVYNKKAKLAIPTGQKRFENMVVFVGFLDDIFSVGCDGHPADEGRARGVKITK